MRALAGLAGACLVLAPVRVAAQAHATPAHDARSAQRPFEALYQRLLDGIRRRDTLS